VDEETIQLVKRVVPFTSARIPLAVGFGVSKPTHVKSIVAAGADGVIVGSAFINLIQKRQNNIPAMLEELETTAIALKEATKI
jgi:tryptophan synthase alpha chain